MRTKTYRIEIYISQKFKSDVVLLKKHQIKLFSQALTKNHLVYSFASMHYGCVNRIKVKSDMFSLLFVMDHMYSTSVVYLIVCFLLPSSQNM